MKMIEQLELANQAPLIERELVRRPAIAVMHAIIMICAILIMCYGLNQAGNMRYIALLGLAPAIGIVFIWPVLEALGYDKISKVTGVYGLDAAIYAQINGFMITGLMFMAFMKVEASLIILASAMLPLFYGVYRLTHWPDDE
jgi:hypothetical protein